jgi:phage RecT family recombinase
VSDVKPADPKPQNVVSVIANTLRAADLQSVLKTHLPPDVGLDKFTSATIEAIKRKPELFEDADRSSLYNAVVEAARDGLVPDGKQGALVPFSTKVGTNTWVKKVQFLIMPEGIIAKLAKLGITCYAVSVYANDDISIWFDDEGQHVKHEPVVFGDRGERVGAYACARTKTGATYIEAMSMEDLEVPKRATKSKNDKGELYGPWRDTPDRMEQKSCLHRLCKRVPGVDIGDDPEFRDHDGPGITVLPREKPAALERPRALQAVVDTAAAPITPDAPVAEPPASEIF